MYLVGKTGAVRRVGLNLINLTRKQKRFRSKMSFKSNKDDNYMWISSEELLKNSDYLISKVGGA